MAGYSTAQVDELLADEVTEIRPSPMPWRRFGFVAVALGTVGAVVGVTRPRAPTPIEEMQHLAIKTHSFMQKVLERGLMSVKADDEDELLTQVGFTFAEKGTTPDKMKMTAHLRPAAEKADKAAIIFSFKAKDDQGSNLKDQLQRVIDAGKGAEKAPPPAKEMLSRLKLTAEGDHVHIRVEATEDEQKNIPPFEDISQDMLDSEASFKLEVGTGHDFSEIANNVNGCPQTVWGGVKATMSTKLARACVEALETNSPVPVSPEQKRELDVFAALDSVSAHVTTSYTKEKLEKEVCDHDPEATKAEMEGMKQMAPHMAKHYFGEEFVEALTGLHEFSDSFSHTRFVGMLPGKYEIALEFENFKLAPVFKEFLAPE